MRFLVTGCAGFIGSNLVDRLLIDGHEVVGLDNLSTGRIEFLERALLNNNFLFHEIDLQNSKEIRPLFKDVDLVFHLAANADVRFGTEHPRKDLEQNIRNQCNFEL